MSLIYDIPDLNTDLFSRSSSMLSIDLQIPPANTNIILSFSHFNSESDDILLETNQNWFKIRNDINGSNVR
jgi:hypothetical protein